MSWSMKTDRELIHLARENLTVDQLAATMDAALLRSSRPPSGWESLSNRAQSRRENRTDYLDSD